MFSLAGYTSAELTFTTNYQNFAGQDNFDVNLWSNGTELTTLIGWNEDIGSFRINSAGFDVQLNLNPYVALSNLQVAFRYYDLRDNVDGYWDWYAQVDDVVITATGSVPEPATMLLYGTSLVGLAGVIIRRKMK